MAKFYINITSLAMDWRTTRIATYTSIKVFKTKSNIASVKAADAEDIKMHLPFSLLKMFVRGAHNTTLEQDKYSIFCI